MRLDGFLADLLYRHDCVVVPGFGGLVANYRSARLDRHSHFISPPAKHIGFNRNLTANDGLLAHHVAAVLQLGYPRAMELVNAEVESYRRTLASGQRVVWEKIGFLYYDHTGNLQFIPDEQENFLPAAFGLQGIQLKPIAIAATPVIDHPATTRRYGWVAAAVAVPLLAAGIFFFTRNGPGEQLSLNPFRHEIPTGYAVRETAEKFENEWPADDAPLENLLTNKPSVVYSFLEAKESENGIEVFKQTAPAVTTATKPVVAPVKSQKKFTLIAGAFAVPENAKKFISQLAARGIEAFDAGERRGLKLVGVGSYDTHEEARQAQRNLQSGDGMKVWIRK